jgi:UDP-perosamine 4-acetyltransferase
VVILGAGGHAAVVVDSLLEAGEHELAACLGESGEETILGVPVLPAETDPRTLGAEGVFVAVGDNGRRKRLMEEAAGMGLTMVNAVHPRAVVSRFAVLGTGVAVMAGAVVNARSEIGDGCIVNTGASVDHDCRVGAYAHVAPGTRLCGRVELGEGVFLGVGASVLPEVRIGAWAVVGAGAVVRKDIPGGSRAWGVPASVTGNAK